jgi:hypothetical protein
MNYNTILLDVSYLYDVSLRIYVILIAKKSGAWHSAHRRNILFSDPVINSDHNVFDVYS